MYVDMPTGTGTITGGGGLVTVNYYAVRAYEGLWAVAGGGYFQLTSSVDGGVQQFGTPAILAAAGWRWYWPSGINFGAAFGGSAMFTLPAHSQDLSFTGFIPVLLLQLGIAF